MSDTVKRIVAEAAVAKRFENEIHERASSADIPVLVENAERHSPQSPIAFDTDGVPYLTIGE